MIPRYAPEWTNHNPSDPGITLIELAAWMTDLLIYRLNQVPDKNYVAFLNLLGIKLRAPRAAKALIAVHARRGRDQAARPARHAGVDAAGDRGAHRHVRDRARRRRHDGAPRSLLLVLRRELLREQPLHRSRAGHGRRARSRCSPARSASSASSTCPIRGSRTPASRRCCACSSARPSAAAAISRACSSGSTGTARAGRSSSPRRSTSIAARSRSSARSGSSRRRSTTSRACGCAAGSPRCPQSPEDTEIDTIRARVEVVGEGLLPTQAYANLDNNAFLALDLSKNIYPFGKEPKVDCVLYLACDELLQTADAYISIEMLLADADVIPRPNPSRAARARVGVLGRQALASPRPHRAARRAARRRRRARLPRRHQGDVAVRHGQLPPPEGHGGARDQRRRPSAGSASASRRATTASRARTRSRTRSGCSRTTARCGRRRCARSRSATARTIATCATCSSFNDFQYTDCTEVARTEYTIFQPFQAKPEESPALYLGFAAKPPERSDRRCTSSSRRSSAWARCRPTRPRSRPPSSTSTRRCAGSRGRAASASCGSTGTAASGSRSPSTTRPRASPAAGSRSSSRPTTG